MQPVFSTHQADKAIYNYNLLHKIWWQTLAFVLIFKAVVSVISPKDELVYNLDGWNEDLRVEIIIIIYNIFRYIVLLLDKSLYKYFSW